MDNFKKGDFVAYIKMKQAKHPFTIPEVTGVEFGIIKDIVERKEGGIEYRVLYHTGDTSALTKLRDLVPITNASMIKEMIEKFGDLNEI